MDDDLRKRSAQRRKRMVGPVAANHEEAEDWDLEFWQRLDPEARLSALIDLLREVELVQASRKNPRRQEDVRVLRKVQRKRKNS